MIKLRKVSKIYKDAGRLIFAANEIDIELQKGAFISVVGPSGSGKTTLLSLVGCLTRPSSGEVVIDGQDTTRLGDNELSDLRGQKIGFIFQGSHVIPNLTVLENVLLPLVFVASKDIAQKKERAKKLIAEVGLGDRAASVPRNMSGGQVKRIAIARALINSPEILLADEPTGDLDQESSGEIMQLLKKINKEDRVTILLVTHNQELADSAGIKLKMKGGKIC